MVANLARLVLPSVDVHMLILDAIAQFLADKHVVKSLAVGVKQICVSLSLRDLRSIVKINEARRLDKGLDWRNLGELVKVTSSNNMRLAVLLEDLGNKVLQMLAESRT